MSVGWRPSSPKAGEEIDALASDYQRAQHCRARAEFYRNEWFMGREVEVESVKSLAAAGDRRFRKRSLAELESIGRSRWRMRVAAQDLIAMEQMYTRWAMMYLEFAKFATKQSLPTRFRGDAARIAALNASGQPDAR